ncbi:hypothetical protein PV755_09180 [Streptomyces caniscabiei]|uniref:Uncharacterized protein n=1 Tax=Streptomyces caniscabiei TaxID=2746961 RepID=A0A927QHG5_9ACTN|nr:hypothetical protein [Streptomyces caniscabiei]MBD9721902.1 hypothetical protein [Streptomyces caniscabiei]MDX3509093.1 hypothetical protein [Streptomyces caniscabiei]MDX3717154.1 hypothetical protein [Streptomyces caniscabiei]WEO23021.1 hypothetical protein IHE65_07545 [Streptomyces caniscabiei]
MTLPIARLDVDLHVLVDRLRAQRLAAGAAAEQRHLLDPADHAFAALACSCPTACSCAADYPGWTPTKEKTS